MSTCRAVSLTRSSRPRTSSRTPIGTSHSAVVRVDRAEVLQEQQRDALGGAVQPGHHVGVAGVRPHRAGDPADGVEVERVEVDHRAVPVADGGGDGAQQRVVVRAAPGEQHQQRVPGRSSDAEAQQREGRLVGQVGVVDDQHARAVAGGRGQPQRVPHRPEEPGLLAGSGIARGGLAHGAEQAGHVVARRRGRARRGRRGPGRAAPAAGRAPARRPGRTRPGTRARPAPRRRRRVPRPRAPRPAGSSRCPPRRGRAPPARRRAPGRAPRAAGPARRRDRRTAPAAGCGDGPGVRVGGGAAAVEVVPALTASYSAVVSCSGGTPSSRDRVRTHSRYWCRAPARSPVPASSRIVAWWAGSCSGSSASHRRATRSAPVRSPAASRSADSRARTATSSCRTVCASPSTQVSNPGASRTTKPSSSSPPAASAASSNLLCAASPRNRSTSTSSPGASATWSRPATTASGPRAERRVDSVRRSAPRAWARSWSGQSRSATASRGRGFSDSASRARTATALRVSNRTGAPSRSTRGGPSSRIPITAHLVTDGRLRPPAVTMRSRNDSGTQVRHRRAIGAAGGSRCEPGRTRSILVRTAHRSTDASEGRTWTHAPSTAGAVTPGPRGRCVAACGSCSCSRPSSTPWCADAPRRACWSG